jgi:hypothetical protein
MTPCRSHMMGMRNNQCAQKQHNTKPEMRVLRTHSKYNKEKALRDNREGFLVVPRWFHRWFQAWFHR